MSNEIDQKKKKSGLIFPIIGIALCMVAMGLYLHYMPFLMNDTSTESILSIIDSVDTCKELVYIPKIPVGKGMALSMASVMLDRTNEETMMQLQIALENKFDEVCSTGIDVIQFYNEETKEYDWDGMNCEQMAWVVAQASIYERDQQENEFFKRCFEK